MLKERERYERKWRESERERER